MLIVYSFHSLLGGYMPVPLFFLLFFYHGIELGIENRGILLVLVLTTKCLVSWHPYSIHRAGLYDKKIEFQQWVALSSSGALCPPTPPLQKGPVRLQDGANLSGLAIRNSLSNGSIQKTCRNTTRTKLHTRECKKKNKVKERKRQKIQDN